MAGRLLIKPSPIIPRLTPLIPANAGIQDYGAAEKNWIPAFASPSRG